MLVRLACLFLGLVSVSAHADWSDAAQRVGVTLSAPKNFDPLTHRKSITYFVRNIMPPSMETVPKAEQPLTAEEGQRFYFEGMLPLVETANKPSPSTSEFQHAINEGLVVEPPCATTNSQVMEHAFRKAKMDNPANLFADPNDYWPTHNNEVQMALLGFHYFLLSEYVAPKGAVGMWDRYTFDGIPGHSGHIFIIFQDTPLLVGDNTRRESDPHGHPYRAKGEAVGFWLPQGVFPRRR
jgi:hypothetical protein